MNALRTVLWMFAAFASATAAPFGTTYPLLGEFSDLALDEARSVVYISNFTASRIEVFSTATRTLQAPIRLGINPSAVALSPDGRFLLILNFGSASLFMLDLETRAVQTVSLPGLPRAAAFGSDGAAVIIAGPVATAEEAGARILRFNPATGEVTTLLPFDRLLGNLPVPQPTFPAEILNAKIAVSPDRNTMFAAGSLDSNLHFVFSYAVRTRTFTTRCLSVANTPTRFASVSPDGTRFMGGQVLFDSFKPVRFPESVLRVLADFTPSGALPIKVAPAIPTAPAPNADRKSTRLNSSHIQKSRMPSSA